MAWVVDRSLDKLVAQINAAAPNRSKASDGSIGDPAHAATVSAHNPEDTADSSDGNDPDDQVDARDFTHDPRFAGSDMAQVTEAIRLSRDRRIRIVIFARRIFSSYATSSRPAWTWGPYYGDNPHDKHAHVETNDLHNDETQPWSISIGGGTAMADLTKDLHYATFEDADAERRSPLSLAGIAHSIQTMVKEIAARESSAPVAITDEQLERVLRKVLGMAPAS